MDFWIAAGIAGLIGAGGWLWMSRSYWRERALRAEARLQRAGTRVYRLQQLLQHQAVEADLWERAQAGDRLAAQELSRRLAVELEELTGRS